MYSITSKMVHGSLIIGACAIVCVAIVVQAQYNTFDSDSNSDSDGNPILTQAELGKLVRNSAKARSHQQHNQRQSAAATRNLYNRQQLMQFAPTHQRRNYGSADSLSGYNSAMGAALTGRGSDGEANDDDSSSSFGPNFGTNFDNNNDDGENNNSDGGDVNLNQAASGHPAQGDYNNEAAGFGFGGQSGYGTSADGSEFGPSEGFSGDGRRTKSASSPINSRNYGLDDDTGAPQYGPNSAINSGDVDDDGRSGYGPEGQSDDNDDE